MNYTQKQRNTYVEETLRILTGELNEQNFEMFEGKNNIPAKFNDEETKGFWDFDTTKEEIENQINITGILRYETRLPNGELWTNDY